VDFYKELSSHGYQLIILRVHAAGTSAVGSIELSLFTCENYSRFEHVGEQVYRQVGIVSYTPTSQKFFGISPNFVRDCMKERFSNTTIIMMGCDGLEGTQMAKAFIDKGAKIYMAWNSSITAGHTDTATENLLRHLVIERKTFAEAVQTTMKEIGPDPACQSYLTYYPAEAGQKKIDNTATAK